jgi:CDP-diglyceride synthetase
LRSLALAIGIVAGVFGGRWGLLAVTIVLAVLATGELLRLVRATGVRPEGLVALAGTIGLVLLAHFRGEQGPNLAPAVVAAVLGLAFAAVLLRKNRTEVPRAIATTLLPVLTVGLLAAFVVAIRNMPEGFRLTLVLVAMVLAVEALPAIAVRARVGGARVGGWQRLIAGAAGALVVALVAGLAFDDTFPWSLVPVLGVATGMAASVGRQTVSMIQADLAIAAEGGRAPVVEVLVRIDGLLLAAPVFFYVFRGMTR